MKMVPMACVLQCEEADGPMGKPADHRGKRVVLDAPGSKPAVNPAITTHGVPSSLETGESSMGGSSLDGSKTEPAIVHRSMAPSKLSSVVLIPERNRNQHSLPSESA